MSHNDPGTAAPKNKASSLQQRTQKQTLRENDLKKNNQKQKYERRKKPQLLESAKQRRKCRPLKKHGSLLYPEKDAFNHLMIQKENSMSKFPLPEGELDVLAKYPCLVAV